jgi:hypothetical protein
MNGRYASSLVRTSIAWTAGLVDDILAAVGPYLDPRGRARMKAATRPTGLPPS